MRRAFTMIELLVVIAVIAILAALIFPVFIQAKASAKKTQCISNLSEIGRAIAIYMTDYDDIFPYAVDPVDKYRPEIWASQPNFQARIPFMPTLDEAVMPYIKSRGVFLCPSDTGTDVVDNHYPTQLPTSPTMHAVYGMSYFFRTEIAFRAFSNIQFELPSKVNVLFDAAGHWHGEGGMMTLQVPPSEVFERLRKYRYNCLYGDFHVKSVKYDQLQAAWAVEL